MAPIFNLLITLSWCLTFPFKLSFSKKNFLIFSVTNLSNIADKVSKFVGKSRSHIANSLRLLSLPKEVFFLIEQEKLSQGHAKILVGLENAHLLARKIIDKKLSVRQSESLVRLLRDPHKIKSSLKDANLKSLEESIEDKTGIKVLIRNKKNNSGQVTFEYKDLDQLNRLIMVIKANY